MNYSRKRAEKALECCGVKNSCEDCPIREECQSSPFESVLAKYAIALVNELKNELESSNVSSN